MDNLHALERRGAQAIESLARELQTGGSLSPRPAAHASPRERRRLAQAKDAAQVYTFEKWKWHRSGRRYLFYVIGLVRSQSMAAILPHLLWVLLISIVVGVNGTLDDEHFLPWWLIFPKTPERMGTEPVALTAFAISLLLVFRTNASYARFDDGRKLWALLLNRSRDLVRQATTFFPESDLQSKATLARWTIVLNKAMLCHLQSVCVLREELENFLSMGELEEVVTSRHPVVIAIQALSDIIEAADITEVEKLQMHANATKFHDILGGCERILRTPIPIAYTRHTTRCVMLWLTFLPYIVWGRMGWFIVPVSFLTAVCLLGINEIGVHIEEPFSILPLESITECTRRDVCETIHLQDFIKSCMLSSQEAAINGLLFQALPQAMPTTLEAENLDLITSLPAGPGTADDQSDALLYFEPC